MPLAVALPEAAVPPLPPPAEHPEAFLDWLAGLPSDEQAKVMQDYHSYREAEEAWIKARPKAKLGNRLPAVGRSRRATKYSYKVAFGRTYLAWKASSGSSSRAPLRDFFQVVRGAARAVSKSDRQWLSEAATVANEAATRLGGLAGRVVSNRGRKATMAKYQTPDRFLVRRRISQGRPYKCPLIRELLWDWFVDIRRSVATLISPKFMILKAREIMAKVLSQQRRLGVFQQMPKLDKNWLHRFKRDKGISFRRPNMRFKCTRSKLLGRLRAMWLNLIRVRRLAQHAVGGDLGDKIWGIDEKPIHFNESGSKGCRTLELAGAPSVRLKENHAATRERVSWMTVVTSCPEAAASAASMPCELLFRAKSARRTRSLEAPPDLPFSIQWAEKGSYRQEHILRFLDRHLPPMYAERVRLKDYRILMMDVAASHISDAVVDFAWTRGYVVILHYGCTTGVAQVNDTDLHVFLERIFIELEQAAFNRQQELDPGCVARTPQDVLDDCGGTWRSLDHRVGVLGHKRNGLSNNLDGSEDFKISREARTFWLEAGMPELRAEAIAEVDALWASRDLASFADWRRLIREYEDPGIIFDEGAELEGDLEEDEAVYDADWAVPEVELDDGFVLRDAEPATRSDIVVEAAPGDDPKTVAEALAAAARLKRLRGIRGETAEVSCPAAYFNLDREVVQLERGLRAPNGQSAADELGNVVLRRACEQATAKERALLAARRDDAFKVRRLEAIEKARQAGERKKAAEEKAKKAARTEELSKLPVTYTLATCVATAAGAKQRTACLDRLCLQAPALPLALEVEWPRVRDWYVGEVARKHPHTCAANFLTTVNDVVERLREHYGGKTPWNAKGQKGGDSDAFAAFVRSTQKKLPVPAGMSITL